MSQNHLLGHYWMPWPGMLLVKGSQMIKRNKDDRVKRAAFVLGNFKFFY